MASGWLRCHHLWAWVGWFGVCAASDFVQGVHVWRISVHFSGVHVYVGTESCCSWCQGEHLYRTTASRKKLNDHLCEDSQLFFTSTLTNSLWLCSVKCWPTTGWHNRTGASMHVALGKKTTWICGTGCEAAIKTCQRHTSCACLGCVFVLRGCDRAVTLRQSCHPGFSPVLVCQLSPADKH